MSRHLGYLNFLMDLGMTVEAARLELKGHFQDAGWRIIEDSAVAAGTGYFTVMPPAAQGVGNEVGEDVARLTITGTTLSLWGGTRLKQEQRHTVIIEVAAGVAATNPNLNMKYKGRFIAPQTGATGDAAFWTARLATAMTADAELNAEYSVSVNGRAITLTAKGAWEYLIESNNSTQKYDIQPFMAAGGIVFPVHPRKAMTIDLANGFAYYLSLFDRTFVLAAETIAAYNGPLVASWADHDAAMRGCPPGCIPVEVLIGDLSLATNANLQSGMAYNGAQFTHVHAYGNIKTNVGSTTPLVRLQSPDMKYHWHAYALPFMDAPVNVTGWHTSYSATQDGMIAGFGAAQYRYMVPLAVGALATSDQKYTDTYNSTFNSSGVVPGYSFPDLHVAMLNAPAQLKLALVAQADLPLALAQPAGISDVTLTVADASGLPAVGTVVFGKEVITYASKAGNVLQGCTRARYGTVAAAYTAGTPGNGGGWFMRYNSAMIFCGYVKPGAVA